MAPLWAFALATWFGIGKLRPAPGSWGSLAALPLAWGLWSLGGEWLVGLGALAVFALGILASEFYRKATLREDPSEVVIDEVAGQLLALALVPPGLLAYALGFLFFRGFDILKPGPIGWADRKIKGGLGIMLDDLMAGVAAGLLLYLLGKGTGWWTTI
ncbi:Phosphatidylglycerophosphatase A [Rhodospirillaceae bacterium LM-1]|nr:Phosphatidylglycerophosphatase A [Rhodospirillaceae bacterium LM-1]